MNNIARQQINRVLHAEQIEQVLRTLLINKPVKLLKFISRTGRNASSVPWIYIENEITGDRMATFISFRDLFDSFWTWLETAQVLFMAFWQQIAIAKVIWQYVEIGDSVYSQKYGWVEVIDKDKSEGNQIPRFWIALDDRIEKLMACEVEIF